MTPLAPPRIKNPYPGLRPFEADESDLFFGRETQTDDLLRRLGCSRFVAVVGTSGSGKSSLVRAGLLPALRGGFLLASGSHWRIAVLRPGGSPIESLASALHAAIYPDAGGDRFVEEMLEITLRRSSLGLVEAAHQARLEAHENLLIVVDQFEELFRFGQVWAQSATQNSAAPLVHLLLEAVRQSEIPVHVMITMRSDFLGDCAQFRDLSEAINDGLYLIPRMTRDQLRLAITAPAAVCGTAMTPRLVQQLLNDVNDDPDQLPVLQHALMRTWNKWQNKVGDSDTIDVGDYEATGGMAEALSRHANEIWEELSDDPAGANKELAKKMFQCLTEKGPDSREVRRPTPFRDLCRVLAADSSLVKSIIEHYRDDDRAFLTPPRLTPLDEGSVIDISHESFIRKWDKLRGWVEEEAQSAAMYRRIAEAARLEKRGEAGLWRNPQLQRALDWRTRTKPTPAWAVRYDPDFEVATDFLERSVAEHKADVERDEEARRREESAERTRKRFLFFLAVGVGALAVLGVLIVKARSLLRESVARGLATHATLLNRQNDAAVAQSLLLATESMRRVASVENEEALRLELALLPREVSRFGGQGHVSALAFSPDGRNVITASDDGSARVSDAATGNDVSHLKHDGDINAIALSPDGRYVAMAGADGTTVVMDTTSGKEISRLKQEGKVNTIAFSPDGRYVATSSEDGAVSTVLVIEAATGNEIARLKQDGKVNAIAFSSDGRSVAVGGDTGDDTGFASVLSADRGRSMFRTLQPRSVTVVAFSADGGALATGGRDYTTRLFSLDTGVEQWRFMHQATVNAIAFSQDGRHLATGSSDQTARVIEVATGKEIARLPNQAVVLSVAFSPKGGIVATGGADGTVRIVESSANKEQLHVPRKEQFYQLGSKTFSAAAFSPDHHYLATADNIGEVRVSEVSTGKGMGPFQVGNAEIFALAFSPNGKELATAGADETVRLLDLAGHQIWERKDIGKVYALAFSHDGRYVIIGGLDGNVRFIDLHNGTDTSKFSLATGEQIAVLAASSGGDRIAIASSKQGENLVHVVSPTGKELYPVLQNGEQVNALIFSPKDGRYLAIAGIETVRVIAAATGLELSRHSYPKQWIYSAAFSADGKMVAIGREDGTIRVIDARTGQELHGLSHSEPVYDLAFSTDNGRESLLAFAGETGYQDLLRRYDLIDDACGRLSPNLTEEQRKQYLPEVDYDDTCPLNKRSTAAVTKP